MGFGNKLTLKTSKQDETVPASAAYNSEYFHSIKHTADVIKPKRQSSFGSDMD